EVSALRKIRLLFEDFPKNHCLVLVAQPELLSRLSLTVNEDIKNCVTYSVLMQKLAPDTIESFIRAELDKVALSHSRLLRRFRSRIATSAGKSTSNPMSSILKPFTISNRSLTPSGESQAAVKRTVSARYPGHVWNIDITVVPLGGGLWCPVLPFSWPMLWPFCWHVAAIVDHF